jgi:hypothetical protein
VGIINGLICNFYLVVLSVTEAVWCEMVECLVIIMLDRVWKEIVVEFQALSWHLSGGSEESIKTPQSGYLRFESRSSF